MKKHLGEVILLLIIVFALSMRLFKIASVPTSVYWDEASIGYNAYSILETGKDEWGEKFPLHFKAFGEYKLPVYIYSTVPFVAALGLNEYSVRLPAVLYTIFSAIFIYLITKALFKKREIALASTFYFVISPWYFIFSRTGYEATAGLAFFLGSIYLFITSLKRPRMFILSSLFLLLSFYSYNSFRVLAPIALIFYLTVLYKRHIKAIGLITLPVLLSVVILAAGIYPTYVFSKNDDSLSRLWTVGINLQNQKKLEVASALGENYLKHFSWKFLIQRGDANPRSQQPGFGQLYILDIIFIPLGLLFLHRKNKLLAGILGSSLFLSLLPSAITREAPHALRAITAVPFLSMMVGAGIYFFSERVKIKAAFPLVIIFYLALFGRYYYNFLTVYPQKTQSDWQSPYKDIFTKYNLGLDRYKSVWVSDRYSQPYIFALFYLKYDPDKFKAEVRYNTDIRRATSLVYSFGKYVFRDVDYNKLEKNTLVFATPSDKLNELTPKEVVNFADGTPSYYVYDY